MEAISKKRAKKAPRRSLKHKYLNSKSKCTPKLTRSSSDEKSSKAVKESVKIGRLSSVKRLLETGFFEGMSITCFSEELGGDVPGIIKGSGILCGCSQCNYKSEVLSAKVFEKHAGANTIFQTDHIFFSNGITLYEVLELVRNIPENDFYVKILKLRIHLKDQKLYEEPPRVPIMSMADKRTKRKGSDNVIPGPIASVKSNPKESSRKSSRLKDEVMNKQSTRVKNSEDDEEATCVLDLLKTGLLEGACIKYISETTQELPGVIKGTGYVCGFSEYSYTGQMLSSHEYHKHAGCTAFLPSNQIFLSNGDSILKVARKIRSLRGIVLKNMLNKLVSLLEFQENNNQSNALRTFNNESDKEKLPAVLDPLHNTFGASRHFFKYYRRYNPERRLIDVRGLLLTGLLEGFRVTYKRNEARLEARIRGSAYECGCSSCNYTKVVTAKELETHAREFSKNQNENIYLDSEMTLYKLVKELKGIPLNLLGNFLQEKIKCSPNYSSFEIWKGSFKMGGGFPNLGSNFDNQSEVNSKCCSVQRGRLNFVGDEWHLGPASRSSISPRIIKLKKLSYDFDVVPSVLMRGVQKHVQKVMFEFSGSESTTVSDFTNSSVEDPDYSPLESTSEKRLTGEERNPSKRIQKRRGRDASLHKRIFEGLPDGTVLTYRYHDKILPTGFKQGSAVKCTCHNYELTLSDFEAHVGLSQKRRLDASIYNSDGKSLHELSLELADIPRSSSVVLSPRCGKRDQNNHHKQITKPLQNSTQNIFTSQQGFAVSTRLRLKRVLQSQKGVLVRCTICKESHASLGDEADPKLIIFCNQCDRAYHVGCLDNQEPFEIEDVLNGTWFCCTDCTRVHDCLTNICALGAKPVPAPFLDLLKRPLAAENNRLNLCWQVFGGGNTEDQTLLSQSLKFIKGAFKPIIHGKEDILRQMVFGKQVEGTGQDFRGVLCIVIKLDEEIISIAVLRVFGQFVAELPLVTSSKLRRQKGYFRMLLSLIEELLRLLQVRLLVAPVHEKMEPIWIHKLGFVKASDQKVQMLKEQHGLILFEDTAILVKEILSSY